MQSIHSKHRLCYISRNYRGVESSGNKAKTDNEDTLVSLGAVNLGLKRSYHKSKISTFFLDLMGIMKYSLTVRPNDIIVLQYPVKKYFTFICIVAKMRGAKTISLIHDLGSFRRKKLTVAEEIKRLSFSDYVIASNEKMKEWLSNHGFSNELGALGLFDYRSSSESPTDHTSFPCRRVVYAGALAMRKNSFILDMSSIIQSYQLHIYGNRDGLNGIKDSRDIIFHGFSPADDFIESVDADFGLVWDGDSLDSCTGSFGAYLQYNSPHKVSFYLRAGLPIIIWRKAAVADIVQKEGIGICIDSIDELNTILPNITDEQMQRMRDNVKRVSDRLKNGYYLSTAINKAI